MRKTIVAGNWKMNLDLDHGKELLINILDSDLNKDTTVIVAPPFIHLNSFQLLLKSITRRDILRCRKRCIIS